MFTAESLAKFNRDPISHRHPPSGPANNFFANPVSEAQERRQILQQEYRRDMNQHNLPTSPSSPVPELSSKNRPEEGFFPRSITIGKINANVRFEAQVDFREKQKQEWREALQQQVLEKQRKKEQENKEKLSRERADEERVYRELDELKIRDLGEIKQQKIQQGEILTNKDTLGHQQRTRQMQEQELERNGDSRGHGKTPSVPENLEMHATVMYSRTPQRYVPTAVSPAFYAGQFMELIEMIKKEAAEAEMERNKVLLEFNKYKEETEAKRSSEAQIASEIKQSILTRRSSQTTDVYVTPLIQVKEYNPQVPRGMNLSLRGDSQFLPLAQAGQMIMKSSSRMSSRNEGRSYNYEDQLAKLETLLKSNE